MFMFHLFVLLDKADVKTEQFRTLCQTRPGQFNQLGYASIPSLTTALAIHLMQTEVQIIPAAIC